MTPSESLTELRLLSSAHFDSESLISAVLCGDSTLPERFRHKSLTALGSRIRTRLIFGPRSAEELHLFLDHLLDASGAPGLMTDELKETLITHCAGNLRVLVGMSAELLDWAAVQERKRLDEQLYFEAYGRSAPSNTPRSRRSTRRK